MDPNGQLQQQYGQQQDPMIEYLNQLYQIASANPNNAQLANAYMAALADYYNPRGSQYEAEQQQRATSLDEAKMLGSFENNPSADAAAMSIISKYYPEVAQQQTTTFDPYTAFKKAKQTELSNYTGAEGNFNPVNQKQVEQANIMQALSQLSPEQYQAYSAPVTREEVLQNLFAPGNNKEYARLKRIGLR